MQKSILKKLRIYMISFGILMGFVFPIYANFFVEWKEGMLVFFIIGCIGAGITVGVVSYRFVKVILLKPLLKVSSVANNLKNKDLTEHIEIISHDSVGDIVNGINASNENIRAFLSEIQNTTEINNQILSKIKLNGNTNTDSIENINQSIKTVTRASKSISEHSSQICFAMVESINSVTDLQIRVDEIIAHIKKMSVSLESLIQNSSKINSILNMVEDIARRTNLVSVNASIEAASAGQYGKSFAIVANEIRELANSVSRSAKDIAKYTNTIGSDIQITEESVKEVAKLIDKNKSSGRDLKNNLDKIESISKSNYKADKQLVSSVDKLNVSFRAIEEVINDLSESTQILSEIITSYKY